MGRIPFLICCWPGLARLWLRGDWSAMVSALGFALLLNFAMLASFIWPEAIGSPSTWIAWPVLAAWWVTTLCRAPRVIRALGTENAPDVKSTQVLSEAHVEYLRGNWLDAEALLNRMLRSNAADVDAWLMKIGLLRRMNRLAEAKQHLSKVRDFDGAAKWSFELAREGQMIDDLERESILVVNEDDSNFRVADGPFEVNDLPSEAA